MKITCPKCSTAYDVKSESFGAAGRSVKCTRCGTRWHVDAAAETPAPLTAQESKKADSGNAPNNEADAWDETDESLDESRNDESDSDETDSATGTTQPDQGNTKGAVVVQETADAESDAAKAPEKPVDIESLAKRPKIRVRKRRKKREGPSVFSKLRSKVPRFKLHRVAGAIIFASALAVGTMAMTLREEIVARVPDLAGLYSLAGFKVNLRGLEFTDLRTFRELESGTIVLVIEGTIENPTRKATYVPAVRLALRSEDAQEIYAWIVEPKVKQLGAGGTTRFRTRLTSPPDLAADIHVRFTERRNQQAKL